jgi:hypothetical protein
MMGHGDEETYSYILVVSLCIALTITIGRFLIVGSRDQMTCTLPPSRRWDLSPLLDHVTQLSEWELRIT